MVNPPHDIKALRGEGVLRVTWGPGDVADYPFRYLRENCGCARCVNEITGERMLDAASIPSDIAIEKMELVGSYAVRIDWSDGHNTGIYSWDRLKALA